MPNNYKNYSDIMKSVNEEFSCEYEACEQLSFELDNDEEGEECE